MTTTTRCHAVSALASGMIVDRNNPGETAMYTLQPTDSDNPTGPVRGATQTGRRNAAYR